MSTPPVPDGARDFMEEYEQITVVRYRLAWTGVRDGDPASGSGRGTNVLVKRSGRWQMAHEHLSA